MRRSDGEKLGTINRVMIDKRSGKLAYAVMTFDGFRGIGDEYRALPWSVCAATKISTPASST